MAEPAVIPVTVRRDLILESLTNMPIRTPDGKRISAQPRKEGSSGEQPSSDS